jgi:predicted secreted Zn-dependent protease
MLGWLGVAVLGWLAVAPAGRAGDTLTVTTNYYRVGGTNAWQVRLSMAQARPWKGQTNLDARTTWDIRWNSRLRPDGDSCSLRSFETKTTIKVTLPAWTNVLQAPVELRARWFKYLEALREHEAGHVRLAQAAAEEIRKRVQALPPKSSCGELSRTIDATAHKVLDEYDEQQARYDQETRHGVNQGARFP